MRCVTPTFVLLHKIIVRLCLSAVTLLLPASLLSGCAQHEAAAPTLYVTASQSPDSLPRDDLFELTLKHNGVYQNKFFDVAIDAVFTAPSGAQTRIKGFYYGGDLWQVRFRPNEVGRWQYTYTFAATNGFTLRGTGVFESTVSNAPGAVVRNPKNRYRWMLANGSAYFPIGLQECIGNGDSQMIDGGTRSEGGRKISTEEYFALYGAAGFNLLRFSQRNCSYPLFNDLDHYREAEAQATDELLAIARRYGFRVMFGFFGSYGLWAGSYPRLLRPFRRFFQRQSEALLSPDDQEAIAKEKRFIDYCIARWGVYADFWELLNERQASDEWTTMMANYVHAADPEHRPVATSWEKPNLAAIDINAPHWYESENELQSDLRVQQRAAEWKKPGKPVIVGEQGNSGMNWDPTAGVRMRIRSWAALFEEVTLVFWNTSWSKWGMHQGHYTPGGASNIYLGPEERGYMRALARFTSRLTPDVQMATVQVSPAEVRAYALSSAHGGAVYLHHVTDHRSAVKQVRITVQMPQRGSAYAAEWIDPATGDVIKTQDMPASGTLEAPPFQVDLALLIRPR